MADPRGRGFNRGQGKWHAPAATMAEVDPVELGWTLTADGYELNGVTLVPFELGWKFTQRAIIGGIERTISQYIGPALLPRLTQEFSVPAGK